MANDYVVIGIAAGLIISAAYVNVITKINSLFTTRMKRHTSLLRSIRIYLGKVIHIYMLF